MIVVDDDGPTLAEAFDAAASAAASARANPDDRSQRASIREATRDSAPPNNDVFGLNRMGADRAAVPNKSSRRAKEAKQ